MMRVPAATCWVGPLAAAAMALGEGAAASPAPDLGVLGNGLDRGARDFAQVLEPRTFEFPPDHGPHPEYRHEWWYVTGNLDSANGERFGFELTFFRFGVVPGGSLAAAAEADRGGAAPVPRELPPSRDSSVLAAGAQPPGNAGQSGRRSAWHTQELYLAHFAVTDVARGRFRFVERLSREALGLAGAHAPPLCVWIDPWVLGTCSVDHGGGVAAVSNPALAASGPVVAASGPAPASSGGGQASWRLHAAQNGYDLSLDLEPLQAPVLNGNRGLSRKSTEAGSASYYYSIPRVAVRGHLVRDGQPVEVQGLAWLDREWGSGALGRHEEGWDWFALQLQDGGALMFYSLRDRGGSRDPNSAGTWVSADGQSRSLSSTDVQIEVRDHWTDAGGVRYPSRWRVRVPAVDLDVDVRPVLADQELQTSPRYWEGAVDVVGTQAGRASTGRGYAELVGYASISGGAGVAK